MTTSHDATWTAIIDAANDRDWPRMSKCLAAGAILHEAGQGLGSTTVRFQGADEIVEGHRIAAEKMGMRWELVSTEVAEDLLTAFVWNVFGNGTRGLAAAVVRFADDGLVSEVYSYNQRPA